MSQPSDQAMKEAIQELLDAFSTNVEVSRYAVETSGRSIDLHVSKLERYRAEAAKQIELLVLENTVKELENFLWNDAHMYIHTHIAELATAITTLKGEK